jgi:2-pyrone-4,6-dicarboxylate lactonase
MAAESRRSFETPCPAPHLHTSRPAIDVPPGACDTHAHLFEPGGRHALKSRRAYTPPPVSVDDYRRMLAALGVQRAVIVHSAVYEDHQVTIDALKASQGQWRAIAVANPAMTEREIEVLHEAGFRGVRFNPYNNPEAGLRGVEELAARIQPFGWHVQLHLNAADLVGIEDRLTRLPVDIVIDHLGHMPTTRGIAHPGFQRLLAMLKEKRCWVKLSAPMRFEDERPPYPGVIPFAQALVDAGPDRVVWGTDWPHVIFDGFMPDDGKLLDILALWAPDAALRKRILVDNPAQLYGF